MNKLKVFIAAYSVRGKRKIVPSSARVLKREVPCEPSSKYVAIPAYIVYREVKK